MMSRKLTKLVLSIHFCARPVVGAGAGDVAVNRDQDTSFFVNFGRKLARCFGGGPQCAQHGENECLPRNASETTLIANGNPPTFGNPPTNGNPPAPQMPQNASPQTFSEYVSRILLQKPAEEFQDTPSMEPSLETIAKPFPETAIVKPLERSMKATNDFADFFGHEAALEKKKLHAEALNLAFQKTTRQHGIDFSDVARIIVEKTLPLQSIKDAFTEAGQALVELLPDTVPRKSSKEDVEKLEEFEKSYSDAYENDARFPGYPETMTFVPVQPHHYEAMLFKHRRTMSNQFYKNLEDRGIRGAVEGDTSSSLLHNTHMSPVWFIMKKLGELLESKVHYDYLVHDHGKSCHWNKLPWDKIDYVIGTEIRDRRVIGSYLLFLEQVGWSQVYEYSSSSSVPLDNSSSESAESHVAASLQAPHSSTASDAHSSTVSDAPSASESVPANLETQKTNPTKTKKRITNEQGLRIFYALISEVKMGKFSVGGETYYYANKGEVSSFSPAVANGGETSTWANGGLDDRFHVRIGAKIPRTKPGSESQSSFEVGFQFLTNGCFVMRIQEKIWDPFWKTRDSKNGVPAPDSGSVTSWRAHINDKTKGPTKKDGKIDLEFVSNSVRKYLPVELAS